MAEILNLKMGEKATFNVFDREQVDPKRFPGWSLQTFIDAKGRFEGVVFKLDPLARTPIGLLTNKVNKTPIEGTKTKELVVEGCGGLILKERGKKAEAKWIDTKPKEWRESDETVTVEISYPPGTYVAYVASSTGMTGCYLGAPAGIVEEFVDEADVPEDFLALYKARSETPPVVKNTT